MLSVQDLIGGVCTQRVRGSSVACAPSRMLAMCVYVRVCVCAWVCMWVCMCMWVGGSCKPTNEYPYCTEGPMQLGDKVGVPAAAKGATSLVASCWLAPKIMGAT